jgi:hypothetical protein
MSKPYENYAGLIKLIHEVQNAMKCVREVRTLASDIRRTAPKDQKDDLYNAISCICEASDELQRAFDDLDELAHSNAPDRTDD